MTTADSDPADPGPETSPEAENEFARQAEAEQPGLIAEFMDFVIHNKMWWLTPIILILLLLAAVIWLGPAAPLIYPLF